MPSRTVSGISASVVKERFVGSRNRTRSSTDFLDLRSEEDGRDMERHNPADIEDRSVEEWVVFRGHEREVPVRIHREEVNVKDSSVANFVDAPSPTSSPLRPILNTRKNEMHCQNTAATDPDQSRLVITHPQTLSPVNSSLSSSSPVRNRESNDNSQSNYSPTLRPASPSKRFSSPRPFLLPRPTRRLDIRSSSACGTSPHFEVQEIYLNETIPTRPFTPTPLSPENAHDFRTPPPRQLVRSRRKTAGSPRPDYGTQNRCRQVLTPTPLEESKLWKVFNEDEESPEPIESPDRVPSPNVLRPHPFTRPASPRYRTASPASGQAYLPFRSSGPSRGLLPSYTGTAIREPSNYPDYPKMDITLHISEICERLMDIFGDLDKYKQFLSHKGDTAQHLLNLLQTLLDRFQLSDRCRTKFFKALLRLSRKSELVPGNLFLTNVQVEGEGPVTDGHFGEIHKGHFQNRPVCLKVVKMYQKLDQHIPLKAFSREAVLWSQLSHINVLPFIGIYRIGDRRDRIGLVSPWMDHGDINEYLNNHPRVDRQLLVSDIACGILYLHNNNVVHGDLKGGNILVTASHRACLADFGLSSVVDSQGLKPPALSSGDPKGGTARFEAPELNDPDVVNPRSQASDIYAFALVCYEVFTGDFPFSNIPNNWAVIMKVVAGERPLRPVGDLYDSRGLTDSMWALMEDCWAHDPMRRLTASEIVKNLLLPRVDRRPPGGWGDQFSRSRVPDGEEDKQARFLVEMLRTLEAISISSFGL